MLVRAMRQLRAGNAEGEAARAMSDLVWCRWMIALRGEDGAEEMQVRSHELGVV